MIYIYVKTPTGFADVGFVTGWINSILDGK